MLFALLEVFVVAVTQVKLLKQKTFQSFLWRGSDTPAFCKAVLLLGLVLQADNFGHFCFWSKRSSGL